MSYSASDFVSDCEANCGTYKVREITADELEDCEPETCEGDALRLLAERVATAMAERQEMLAALKIAQRRLESLENRVENQSRGLWMDQDAIKLAIANAEGR